MDKNQIEELRLKYIKNPPEGNSFIFPFPGQETSECQFQYFH